MCCFVFAKSRKTEQKRKETGMRLIVRYVAKKSVF